MSNRLGFERNEARTDSAAPRLGTKPVPVSLEIDQFVAQDDGTSWFIAWNDCW